MTDCTVAAPVRATKAPARSKAAPSLIPVMAHQPEPLQSEADKLALQAAEILQTMVMSVAYGHNDEHRALPNAHLDEADRLLGRLLDSEEGDILTHLAKIYTELEGASWVMEGSEIPGITLPVHLILVGTTRQAFDFADRLFLAYKNLPGTLEDLRALTTFAGAKPFHNRPQPPIRRVNEAAEQKTTATAAYQKQPLEHLLDQLQIAATIASLLVYNFGVDGDCNPPSEAPGLQGMVFGLQDATRKAHALAIERGIPQAPLIRNAAALAEHMGMLSGAELFSGDHGFRLGDGFLCNAFWSIEHMLEQARQEVHAVVVT
jgi:hypothetical protein